MGLWTHAHAADNGGGGDRGVNGHGVGVIEDLHGQFARGREHQHARGAAAGAGCGFAGGRDEPMKRREHEGGGFARAGHGAGQNILAGQRGGDRFFLDRSGMGEGEVFNAAKEVGVKSEGGKGHEAPIEVAVPKMGCRQDSREFNSTRGDRAAGKDD